MSIFRKSGSIPFSSKIPTESILEKLSYQIFIQGKKPTKDAEDKITFTTRYSMTLFRRPIMGFADSGEFRVDKANGTASNLIYSYRISEMPFVSLLVILLMGVMMPSIEAICFYAVLNIILYMAMNAAYRSKIASIVKDIEAAWLSGQSVQIDEIRSLAREWQSFCDRLNSGEPVSHQTYHENLQKRASITKFRDTFVELPSEIVMSLDLADKTFLSETQSLSTSNFPSETSHKIDMDFMSRRRPKIIKPEERLLW